MFSHFWDCAETIGEGSGFALYSLTHLVEIALCVGFIALMTITYGKADDVKRQKIQRAFVIAVLTDELIKHAGLLMTGNWAFKYMPLHLCSINIFMIVAYYFTKNKVIGNFLYAFCIPAALVAVLFPTWHILPVMNFMHLHSYSVHVLLGCFPIMLVVNKDIDKDYRILPKLIGLLVAIVIPMFVVNIIAKTNFMFINEPQSGTPLTLFARILPDYRIGYVALVAIVVGAMYLPYKKRA